jgi:hypothetical protein
VGGAGAQRDVQRTWLLRRGGGGPLHFACSLLVRTGWPCPGASWPLRSSTWPCWLQEEEERSQRISLPSSSWTFPYSLQYRAMLRSNLTLSF